MNILDLVNKKASQVKYETSKFPDGQQQLKIVAYPTPSTEVDGVQIKTRLNSFLDLELIICTVSSLREAGIKSIHLYAPYFLGSRSDRKFELGSNNYLKDVICPIINNLHFDSVTVLDPHSDILEACLNNFKKINNYKFVEWAFEQMTPCPDFDNTVLLSPDAGALKKIYKASDFILFRGDVVACSKARDEKGNLTNTVVPEIHFEKNHVIIDDICDGGATFINIAKEIKKLPTTGKLYLVVTHGIFSKGFGELQQYFDKVYTTNSYQDLMPDTQLFVKQYNVF